MFDGQALVYAVAGSFEECGESLEVGSLGECFGRVDHLCDQVWECVVSEGFSDVVQLFLVIGVDGGGFVDARKEPQSSEVFWVVAFHLFLTLITFVGDDNSRLFCQAPEYSLGHST